MAVKIRLSRVGKKKAPFYRIVAVDSRKKRDGANLEILGTYDGLEGVIVKLDLDRIDYWINQGAIPTDSVKKLVKAFKKGVKPGKDVKPKKEKKKVEPKQEEKKLEVKTEEVKTDKKEEIQEAEPKVSDSETPAPSEKQDEKEAEKPEEKK